MVEITRRFEFDSAHRVHNHASKCSTLHGHRYSAEVSLTAPELDRLGMVIDFSEVKRIIGGWLDENWDHNTILWAEDHPTVDLISQCPGAKKPYLLSSNPTVENMVQQLFLECQKLLDHLDLTVTHVRLYETPNCWADSFRPGT